MKKLSLLLLAFLCNNGFAQTPASAAPETKTPVARDTIEVTAAVNKDALAASLDRNFIPVTVIVKNNGTKIFNFETGFTPVPGLLIYSLDESGNKTLLFPKPFTGRGLAAFAGTRVTVAPGETRSVEEKIPLDVMPLPLDAVDQKNVQLLVGIASAPYFRPGTTSSTYQFPLPYYSKPFSIPPLHFGAPLIH